MQRPTYRILPLSQISVAMFAALLFVAPNCAAAQNVSGTPGAATRGIRHVISLTVRSDDSDLRPVQQNSSEPTTTLTVKIRISDNSQETNFYGEVSAKVLDFEPANGSREQEVWRDAECHHERGFPKITVISVEGSMMNGEQKVAIAARTRSIGLPLPADEVMAARRLAGGTDDVGPFIATSTETKQSHLSVDLRLYILPCDLQSARTEIGPEPQTTK